MQDDDEDLHDVDGVPAGNGMHRVKERDESDTHLPLRSIGLKG